MQTLAAPAIVQILGYEVLRVLTQALYNSSLSADKEMLNHSVDDKAVHVKRFFERYITSTQIAEFVGVTKVSVYNARKSGKLPNSIDLENLCLWERDAIMPYIEAWRHDVLTRKAFKELTARPIQ